MARSRAGKESFVDYIKNRMKEQKDYFVENHVKTTIKEDINNALSRYTEMEKKIEEMMGKQRLYERDGILGMNGDYVHDYGIAAALFVGRTASKAGVGLWLGATTTIKCAAKLPKTIYKGAKGTFAKMKAWKEKHDKEKAEKALENAKKVSKATRDKTLEHVQEEEKKCKDLNLDVDGLGKNIDLREDTREQTIKKNENIQNNILAMYKEFLGQNPDESILKILNEKNLPDLIRLSEFLVVKDGKFDFEFDDGKTAKDYGFSRKTIEFIKKFSGREASGEDIEAKVASLNSDSEEYKRNNAILSYINALNFDDLATELDSAIIKIDVQLKEMNEKDELKKREKLEAKKMRRAAIEVYESLAPSNLSGLISRQFSEAVEITIDGHRKIVEQWRVKEAHQEVEDYVEK